VGDLSKDFSRHEFVCKGTGCCGGCAPMHPDLIAGLQQLRDKIGRNLTITSGFRCKTHNERVGGETGSYHTLGMAADVLRPPGMMPTEMAKIAETIDVFANGGIGIYPNRIHVDVRQGKARWRK
jgi:zinc D-Ala-D-Ala carboxypeptidase